MARTTAPNPAKRTNPTAPRIAALTSPRLVVGDADEDDREGKDRQGQEAPDPQEGERREPAHRRAGVLPAGGQHPELHGGAHRRRRRA